MRDFTQLEIWKRSHQITLSIYSLSKSYPKDEQFGICSQMKKSASSIPTNIAEGCGRNSTPQLLHFLQIAMGSSSELQYQLILSKDLGFINFETFNVFSGECIQIRKMIHSFSQKVGDKK